MATTLFLGRFLLAAAAAFAAGYFVPLADWFRPSFAVLVFVALCAFLDCATIRGTIVFALLIASVPIVAFTAGMSNHTPLVESFLRSFAGYFVQRTLLVVYLVGPLLAAALAHGVLRRMLVWRAQRTHLPTDQH